MKGRVFGELSWIPRSVGVFIGALRAFTSADSVLITTGNGVTFPRARRVGSPSHEEDDAMFATGYRKLDEVLGGGFDHSELIFLAGRPNMGKTALAMNIAAKGALRERTTTVVFNMESSVQKWYSRLLSSVCDAAERPSMESALQRSTVLIDDTPALTIRSLCARVRRLQHNAHIGLTPNIGLIIIDYLELLEAESASESRPNELAEIPIKLKALAKEVRIPILALCNLKRSLEQRDDKRPVLDDLPDNVASGAIEHADTILLMYRDELYNPGSPSEGLAEISIGIHRRGPPATTVLEYKSGSSRFADLMAVN